MLRRILSKNLAPNNSAAGGTPAPASNAPAVPPAAPKPGAGQVSQTPAAPSIDNAPDASAEKGVFDELDAMVNESKAPPKTPATPAAPKPPEKPVEPKPDPAAAAPQTPPPAAQPPQTPKALRDFANRMETENKSLTSKVTDLERKIAEAEKRGKDTTDLTQRLADVEKAKVEVEKQLYALNIGESPEFKEKYVNPLNEARDYAAEVVEGMEIVTARDEDGNPTSTRKATWADDFLPIFNASTQSTSKANQMARQLFGEDAQTVINHVQELNRLVRVRNKALADHQKNAETERQSKVAAQAKEQEWVRDTWGRLRADMTEKNPDVFQPDPKDTKRAEIWNKSLQLVDTVDNPNGLTPVQRMTVHAAARLRAAAFPVLQYDLNKAKDRIAELEAQLAEITDSNPGNTQRPGGEGGGGEPPQKTFTQELSELTA